MNNNSFSSKAFWRNGDYDPRSHAPEGTLTLSEDGRLSMKLDNGKLLFDVPVSQTKRKYERMYGYMRIVVGPRLYVLQFFQYVASTVEATVLDPMAEAQAKGGKLFKQWRTGLEAHQETPGTADNRQIIAAKSPPTLHGRNYKLRLYSTLLRVALVFTAIGLVAILTTPLGAAIDKELGRKILLGVYFLVLGPLYIFGAFRLRKLRSKIATEPIPVSELQSQPDEIFPPNTPPTAGFGFTTGKQLLLGIVLVLVVIIAIPALLLNSI